MQTYRDIRAGQVYFSTGYMMRCLNGGHNSTYNQRIIRRCHVSQVVLKLFSLICPLQWQLPLIYHHGNSIVQIDIIVAMCKRI